MKKFYFLLIAMMAGFVANAADYYLIGGFNNWATADKSAKFTETATEGVYTLEYAGTLTSGFKVNDGTWTNDACNFGSNGSSMTVGTPYKYGVGGSTGNINMDMDVENPTLTLNINEGTLLVEGQASVAEYIYGIHGEIFGDPLWSTENFTEVNGKWVMADMTVVAGSFGIKLMNKSTGAQAEWISSAGSAAVTLDTPMPCKVEGTNWTITAGTYTFTFDPEAMTLTVSGEGGGGDIDDPQPSDPYTYALHGEIFSGEWESMPLTDENGVWSWTGKLVPGDFGIQRLENGEQVGWLASDGVAEINAEGSYAVGSGVNFTSTLSGNYTVSFNPAESTITFTEYQGVIDEVIAYALRGTIVNGTWEDYAMTEENGNWTVTLSLCGEGEFGIKQTTNGAQSGWYAAPEATTIEATGTYQAGGIGVSNWECTLEGEFTFTFNPETEILTITTALGGVSEIAAENAPAEYFNLQGVRVENPTSGLYIVRQGNKVSKVIL